MNSADLVHNAMETTGLGIAGIARKLGCTERVLHKYILAKFKLPIMGDDRRTRNRKLIITKLERLGRGS